MYIFLIRICLPFQPFTIHTTCHMKVCKLQVFHSNLIPNFSLTRGLKRFGKLHLKRVILSMWIWVEKWEKRKFIVLAQFISRFLSCNFRFRFAAPPIPPLLKHTYTDLSTQACRFIRQTLDIVLQVIFALFDFTFKFRLLAQTRR